MIYLGADHNGFALKEKIKAWFEKTGVQFCDLGAHELRKDDDYPDYAIAVSEAITPKDLGILLCGSGHGMAITANKTPNLRAAVGFSLASAVNARRDDHANVLALAAWELTLPEAKKIISGWLKTKPSSAGRHLRRVKKIKRYES